MADAENAAASVVEGDNVTAQIAKKSAGNQRASLPQRAWALPVNNVPQNAETIINA